MSPRPVIFVSWCQKAALWCAAFFLLAATGCVRTVEARKPSAQASLVITREVGDPLAEGLRLNNLGSVYPRLGDYARARSHLERGLQLARRIGHRSTEAALLLNTASVAHLQGDDTAALALANAAFELSLIHL